MPTRRFGCVVFIGTCTLAAKSGVNSVVGKRQVVNRRHEFEAVNSLDFLDGDGATNHRRSASVVAEIGQHQFNNVVAFVKRDEERKVSVLVLNEEFGGLVYILSR